MYLPSDQQQMVWQGYDGKRVPLVQRADGVMVPDTRRRSDGYIISGPEKRALDALRMLHRDDLLEYVDSIATGRTDNKAREQRLMGLLCNLADARAALGD